MAVVERNASDPNRRLDTPDFRVYPAGIRLVTGFCSCGRLRVGKQKRYLQVFWSELPGNDWTTKLSRSYTDNRTCLFAGTFAIGSDRTRTRDTSDVTGSPTIAR